MSHSKLLLSIALAIPAGCLTTGCGQPSSSPEAASSGPAAAAGDQKAPPSDEELRDRIDRAVNFGRANRHLNGDQNAAWQVVHGLLAFGKD
ncbi:MAG TPA: hypothetical protein VGG30_00610, partial [Pirellulales bacterium]